MEATREHPEVLTAFKLEFIHSDIIRKASIDVPSEKIDRVQR
jgi:hypothetical protein